MVYTNNQTNIPFEYDEINAYYYFEEGHGLHGYSVLKQSDHRGSSYSFYRISGFANNEKFLFDYISPPALPSCDSYDNILEKTHEEGNDIKNMNRHIVKNDGKWMLAEISISYEK